MLFQTQVLVPSNGLFYHDVDPKLAASVCRSHNNANARIVKSYPGKFIGLTTVPLEDPVVATEELARSATQLGLRGPVIAATDNGKNLDDEPRFHIYSK